MLTDAGITAMTDENIFIAAACKEKGIQFLQGKAKSGVRKNEPAAATPAPAAAPAASSSGAYTVTLNGKNYAVKLNGDKAEVNGKAYDVSVKAGVDESLTAKAAASAEGGKGRVEVRSQLPGNILRIEVAEGDAVKDGDVLLVMEAMKMEVEIKAPVDGVVASLEVAVSEQVPTGRVLVTIND